MGTDVSDMSDTAVATGNGPMLDLDQTTEANSGSEHSADHARFFLDGEMPRLATGPTAGVAPDKRQRSTPISVSPAANSTPHPSLPSLPTLPVISPVLSSPAALAHGPAGITDHASDDAAAVTNPARHPMAHLMPEKMAPSEASRRAAETRAAQKKKAKRTKMIVIGCMLVFTAVVGPPLWKWLTNALNEAGKTSPAVEVSAD
jgi:hypothetical protein